MRFSSEPVNRWLSGVIAGVVAAAAVSLPAALLGSRSPAILDEVGLIAEWLRVPRSAAWTIFVSAGGTVCGFAIAALGERKRGISGIRKGVAVGVLAWAVQALWIWPRTAAGFLGAELGWSGPILTLAGHVLFGVILGAVYGGLRASRGASSVR